MKLRLPQLSDSQILRLADMCADLAIVFVASVVLPAVFGRFEFGSFLEGTIFAILFGLISLRLSK